MVYCLHHVVSVSPVVTAMFLVLVTFSGIVLALLFLFSIIIA